MARSKSFQRRVSLNLAPDVLDELDEMAREMGVTRNVLIRLLIHRSLTNRVSHE